MSTGKRAIVSKESLDKAVALFRSGKSPRECEKLTGVNYRKIDREAKIRGVVKGDLSQLVSSMADNEANFGSLSVAEQGIVTKDVTERTNNLKIIHEATIKNLSVMMAGVGGEGFTGPQGHKFIQETINKGGEALGVLEKGGISINNTAQAGIQVKIADSESNL